MKLFGFVLLAGLALAIIPATAMADDCTTCESDWDDGTEWWVHETIGPSVFGWSCISQQSCNHGWLSGKCEAGHEFWCIGSTAPEPAADLVVDALANGELGAIRSLLELNPDVVTLNLERRSIQVRTCATGGVAANIPVSRSKLETLVTQRRDQY